ncbi:SRPBCC family protein [Jatrophihabitans telluris]|uniref:SRPBCC family protein n=1 Tax=Jatrophihabitans telluris TaxID=2038343 RepID=A0ABY4R1Z4_9ACTN|nr:SRPBCC family protein [Jatrophihabitans telluris]UQX89160.1 SRPBCC family protein [Jatrophihabitans telluris]
MSAFSARVQSTAVVPAARQEIWQALTDPVLLPKLTPLLRHIDADGDRWRWHLGAISALGVEISPVFTEQMVFQPQTRISYTHSPPAGAREYAGAEGVYALSDAEHGTNLSIELTLTVELPLPRLSAPAVERIIRTTMDRTGDKFSANLLKHLGVR